LTDLSDPQMGELETKPKKIKKKPAGRQIVMLGTAPSTRKLAPLSSEDWEVWGQGDYWKDMDRVDRWFEFAPHSKLVQQFPEFLEFLRQAPFPVYMREKFKDIPQSTPFPFEEMSEKYGKEFMSATLVWMMCMALEEHMEGKTVKRIGLFGYDMALDAEYASQRPGIRHLEWVCREHIPALGFDAVEVLIPKGSDLSITPIPYPFAEDDLHVAKIRARGSDLTRRISGSKNQEANLQAQLDRQKRDTCYLEGALENNVYYERMACGQAEPAA